MQEFLYSFEKLLHPVARVNAAPRERALRRHGGRTERQVERFR